MNLPITRLIYSAILGVSLVSPASGQEKLNFEDHIKPIFRSKCASCHNTNKKTADLDLSNYTAMMQGGGSGAVIEPGDAANSYLFMVINHDSEPYMPPNSDKIPDAMVQAVRNWIDAGAPETSSSKVMLPKKPKVNLSVDASAAGTRPDGPAPLPDVLGMEPVVHTSATTAVSAIATSPWAKLVAVAGQKQVVLYSSETLQPMGVLAFPEGQARVLKFSRNGALLLAGGGQGAAKGLAVVWDIKTGQRIMQVGDELDEVLAADISADQSLVALGGPGKVVRVYSTATGELAYEIVKHTDWVTSLEFSPDSILLATADRSGGLHVWESFTGREYLTLPGHKGGVNAVSWRIDSNVLASASEDATIQLWEMEEGRNIKNWSAHGGGTLSLEFCRDGRLVSCGRDKTAKIWDQNGAQQLAFEAFGDLALQVSHCDDTNRVVAGDWTGEVRVWNAADGVRVGNLTTNPPMLDTRLQLAEAKMGPLNQSLADARKQLDAATSAKDAHVQKIEAAKQEFAKAQKTLADRQAILKTEEGQMAEAQKQQTATQQKLVALQKAVPDLAAAADKAGQASAMMTDDVELKKVVESLNAQVAVQTKELADTEAAMKTINADIAKYTKAIEVSSKQAVVDEQQVVAQKTGLDTLIAALKPLDESLASMQNQVNASQETVNSGIAEIERWKQYIALRDELKLLQQKQAEKQAVHLASLEADAAFNEKQQQIEVTQQQVQMKTQLIAASQKKMADMTAIVAAAEQQQVSMKESVAQMDQAIPILQTAVQQAKSALEVLPADVEIKKSVEALEQTTGAKVAALAAAKLQLTEVDKKVTDIKAEIVAVVEIIAAAEKEMAAAQDVMKSMVADSVPIQKQAEEAKAKLAAAEAELSKAQQLVEARKEKLRPQLQVTQVSAN